MQTMNHRLTRLSFVALVLGAACESSSTPAGPVPTKTAAAEPAKAAAAEPAKAVPQPASAATPPASPTPTPPSSPLHVVAYREGSIQLMRLRSGLSVVLDGEPVPIVGSVPTRGPSGSRGLPNLAGFDHRGSTFAIGGALDHSGTVWVSTGKQADRSASSYWVHRNRNQGLAWEQVDLRRGPLVAYHLAYVERGGALFGLRAWQANLSDSYWDEGGEGAKASREWKAVQRAMAKVRTGFVHLEGPAIAAPELPADAAPQGVTTTDDGTVYVWSGRPGEDPALLVWAPQQQVAERVELPDYDHGYLSALLTNGDVAMVVGTTERSPGKEEPYLAVGHGTKWERVAVSLPERHEDASIIVEGAARSPAGELWLVLAEALLPAGHGPSLWRAPAGGAFETVPLPRFGDELFGREEGYVYDTSDTEPAMWRKVPRPSLEGVEPQPTAIAWADGAMWIVVDLGEAYDGENGMVDATRRHALLSTGPAPATPLRLPSRGELIVERLAASGVRSTPGTRECKRPAFVLGPPSLLDARPGLVEAVRKAGESLWTPGVQIFVGRLDAAEELVASARTESPAEVEELRTALAEAVGSRPIADCRVPSLAKVVGSP